jgi:hypothetical protein
MKVGELPKIFEPNVVKLLSSQLALLSPPKEIIIDQLKRFKQYRSEKNPFTREDAKKNNRWQPHFFNCVIRAFEDYLKSSVYPDVPLSSFSNI